MTLRPDDVKESWAQFLNPDVVRSKLVMMGLFMIAHELMMKSIKDRPLGFFADSYFDTKPSPSTEYRNEVLALDPKGKGDAFRGSIAWLLKLSIIDDEDEKSIRDVTDARNLMAHELHKFIGGEKMPDLVKLLPLILGLVTKIERWWIINFDLTMDPGYDGVEVSEEDITPYSIIIMQILLAVATGDEEEAWALHRKIVEER